MMFCHDLLMWFAEICRMFYIFARAREAANVLISVNSAGLPTGRHGRDFIWPANIINITLAPLDTLHHYTGVPLHWYHF